MNTVLISQRIEQCPRTHEISDALDHRLMHLFENLGILPIPLPNTLTANSLSVYISTLRPTGFVLSGGNDIGQYPQRDRTEMDLLCYAQAHCLPVLGICRGMQMLGHWAGVNTIPVKGHAGTRHIINSESVNSYHNFALQKCPEDFYCTALCSDDNVIEAIQHKTLPWLGWMWHPEREQNFSSRDCTAIRKLFLCAQ